MTDVLTLARRYASWIDRAITLHRLLRGLVMGAQQWPDSENGTYTIVVPAAEWRAVVDEASIDLPALGYVPLEDDLLYDGPDSLLETVDTDEYDTAPKLVSIPGTIRGKSWNENRGSGL